MPNAQPTIRRAAANLLPQAALLIFTALGLYGSTLGWGTDRDSLRVIGTAITILHGHYQRSRSFGFPLHEAASALLYATGGLRAANLGSLAVTLVGIAAALRITADVAPQRVGLAAIALCGSPLLLVNASAAIDFGWSFAAGMALLVIALAVQRAGPNLRAGLTACTFVTVSGMVLLRPDNLLFAAAIIVPLCVSLREKPVRPGADLRRRVTPNRAALRVAGAAIAAAACAAAIYLALNGPGIFATAVTTTRPFPARIARAAALLTAALGPGGILAAAALARHSAPNAQIALLRRATALSWLLYLPRFAALPDQLDYLILSVELTALLAAATLPPISARLCVALICIPSVITVSFLARNPRTGALHTEIAPQWGALPQDWAARRFAMHLQQPAMARYIAAQLTGPGAPTTLHPHTYLPGFISPAGDLVIGQAELYHLINTHTGAASLPTVPRAWFRAIWACPYPLGPTIGWRAWEAPAPPTILAKQQAGAPSPCTPSP